MYRKQISQKASPSQQSTPKSQDIAPSRTYGSLSAVVQRVQQDPNSMSEDEGQQLESAIGTRSMRKILAGKQTPWVPEFQGISQQLGAPIQAKRMDDVGISQAQPEHKTGLPDHLKTGIENLSGMVMDDVSVHYNSSKPSQLQALAYTQGTDIHVAPGQEKHLPHEAWHVVQQKQGRVKPTMQLKDGIPVNDDQQMEREADVMGARAASQQVQQPPGHQYDSSVQMCVVQRVKLNAQLTKKLKEWVTEAWGGDTDGLKEVIDWFAKATISQEDVKKIIDTHTLDDWWEWAQGVDPKDVDPEDARKGSSTKGKAADVDPLAKVRKELRGRKLKPEDFTESELQAIDAGKAQGWDAAIQSVNQQRIERQENARLRAERITKYAPAKAAGDLVFPMGTLVRQVWDYSYAVAVSGNAGPNDTLSGLFTDVEILAAVALWNHRGNIVPLAPPAAEAVTNFHVPDGGTGIFIQDKSTRLVNPDPNRGRQADFICHWGAVTINVHVDATPQH
ncbi:DUF4157 domain-containing protein [Calothrix sp. PCC 7507]|uniref:eCIS core domain-containing protein n=1 Tax=Calothrix sp. PCC 7507 TaxID=99598 RepID=UPI00029EEA1A|nr:DUF4157 domain-containing protein [Calothrix sp. PCC 7507]AFY33602.1 hypothetical protein Cal7507_3194 [Calothrix sp. PCC 7507]